MQKIVNVSDKIIGSKDHIKLDISNVELISILVHELSKEIGINPEVQCISKEKSIWVIFSDSCFECDFLIDNYALIIAAVSEKYPIVINGIINDFEEGEIKFFYEEDRLKLNKSNASGKDFLNLSDLCLKINVEKNEEIEILNEALSNIRYNRNCIAIRRKWDKYFSNYSINNNQKVMKYNYIPLETLENKEYDYINSLSILQMKELWLDFLVDHHTALEFELLYNMFQKRSMEKMHLWELALRIALSECEFSVEYYNKQFNIIDRDGNHIYYNFESYSSAEKLLLKILFPVKTNLY
ncbi:hypothetical protein FDB29_05540 [Clostridium botulinum]|nr:hypothetical protein [Clostridium botulinum]